MQITVTLPDEIGNELISLPAPDTFIAELIKAALLCRQLGPRRQPSPLIAGKDEIAESEIHNFPQDSDVKALPEAEDPLKRLAGMGEGTGEAVARHHDRWLYGEMAK